MTQKLNVPPPCATDDDDRDLNQLLDSVRLAARLGQRLLNQNVISADQLRIALHEQKKTGAMLGAALTTLGFIDQEELTDVLADHAGLETIDLRSVMPDPALSDRFPPPLAQRLGIVPLRMAGARLTVAVSDPYDLAAQDEVRRYFPRGTTLDLRLACASAITALIARMQGPSDALGALLQELEGDASPHASAAEHPVVRFVDHLLFEAAEKGASDIHFEPEETFVRVRFRIDGVLQQTKALHLSHWPALSHRIKIMANMNIADQRSIQDGRFQKQIDGATVDCRVAVMPSVWGETIVVRLLDHRRSLLPLDALGYGPRALEALRQIARKPQGISFLTGPTGSGKTTTLYSILKELSTPEVHIATLEEPVEYQMELVRQTAVQDGGGVGFAEGVRGLLRMDPDIILIGEVRDAETAAMALRAAMTGHQVYATLHSNDALGALARMADLELNPRGLEGNLSGLVAQRLVRRLCPHCLAARKPDEDEKALIASCGLRLDSLPDASGCAACGHTGRLGRTAIAEVLPISASLDALIAAAAPRRALFQQAVSEGFMTMRQDGLARVASGEIALADLARAVDLTREEEQ